MWINEISRFITRNTFNWWQNYSDQHRWWLLLLPTHPNRIQPISTNLMCASLLNSSLKIFTFGNNNNNKILTEENSVTGPKCAIALLICVCTQMWRKKKLTHKKPVIHQQQQYYSRNGRPDFILFFLSFAFYRIYFLLFSRIHVQNSVCSEHSGWWQWNEKPNLRAHNHINTRVHVTFTDMNGSLCCMCSMSSIFPYFSIHFLFYYSIRSLGFPWIETQVHNQSNFINKSTCNLLAYLLRDCFHWTHVNQLKRIKTMKKRSMWSNASAQQKCSIKTTTTDHTRPIDV